MTQSSAAPSTMTSRQVLTVPNLITLLRLLILTPLFVLLLLALHSPGWALLVAMILGSTDWVDGVIARRFHQVTELGRALDPVADRLSQIAVCATLVVAGLVPIWMGVIVVAADTLLGAAILLRRPGTMPVRWIGRIRTAALMIGLPAVLAVEAFAPDNAALRMIALGVIGVGVILHAIADLTYIWGIATGTVHQHHDAHPSLPPSPTPSVERS